MNIKKSFKELVPGLALSLIMSFMLLFFEPLILYFTNIDQFWFDIYTLAPIMFIAWIIGAFANLFILAIIYFIKKKIYWIALVVESVCFIALYIQGNYLSSHLPAMDGTTVNWSDYNKDTIISVVLWVVVIAAVVFAVVKFGLEKFTSFIPVVSVCMLLMFMVTLSSVCFPNNGFQKKLSKTVTDKYQFEMSKDKNFIIFVIDACDSRIYGEIANKNPQYEKMFEDFTYYPDTLAAYPFTSYSIPFILGGEWADNTVSYTEYSTSNYKNSPFLNNLKNEGYKIGLYEDELTYEDDTIYDIQNVSNESQVTSRASFIYQEMMYSLFKYMPYGTKRFFPVDMSAYNSLQGSPDDCNTFSSNNSTFYDRMNNQEITFTDDKVFRFMHIEGAHVPFQYDKNVNLIDPEEGTYEQNIEASMTIVGAYLDKLKKAGVYDNSVIIIMSDHGYNTDPNVDDHTPGRQNPILFVKGIDEHHSMEVSEAPISYDDLQDSYSRLLKGKTGKDVFNSKAGDIRERRYLLYYYLNENHMVEYYTNGHASDTSSMVPSGNIYDLKE